MGPQKALGRCSSGAFRDSSPACPMAVRHAPGLCMEITGPCCGTITELEIGRSRSGALSWEHLRLHGYSTSLRAVRELAQRDVNEWFLSFPLKMHFLSLAVCSQLLRALGFIIQWGGRYKRRGQNSRPVHLTPAWSGQCAVRKGCSPEAATNRKPAGAGVARPCGRSARLTGRNSRKLSVGFGIGLRSIWVICSHLHPDQLRLQRAFQAGDHLLSRRICGTWPQPRLSEMLRPGPGLSHLGWVISPRA